LASPVSNAIVAARLLEESRFYKLQWYALYSTHKKFQCPAIARTQKLPIRVLQHL